MRPRPFRSRKVRLITRIRDGSGPSPLSNNMLTSPQRRLEPFAPLHRAPQTRLEPQRLLALQHGFKLRNPEPRLLPDALRPAAISRAAAMATTPTQHASFEKLKRPRPPAAVRTEKETPRTAAGEPHQLQADLDLNVGNADRGPRHLGGNGSARPHPRNTEARQIVLKGHETTR